MCDQNNLVDIEELVETHKQKKIDSEKWKNIVNDFEKEYALDILKEK